jgi:hypothetical protein
MEGVGHNGNVIPEDLGCPRGGAAIRGVAGFEILGPRQEVWKVGCTTGFTRGRVTAIGLSDLTVWTSFGNIVFDDVVEIRPVSGKKAFSAPGDSGSLVFTSDLKAFGLHFAGGSVRRKGSQIPVSYCCSLLKVLDFFRLELVM